MGSSGCGCGCGEKRRIKGDWSAVKIGFGSGIREGGVDADGHEVDGGIDAIQAHLTSAIGIFLATRVVAAIVVTMMIFFIVAATAGIRLHRDAASHSFLFL